MREGILKYYPYPKFRKGHKDTLRFLEECWDNFDIALVIAPTGCHAAGQEIVMYDGTLRKVEDILVGDVLLGPDGGPRNVLCLHRGVKTGVKIIPNKGNSYTVTEDHTLHLRQMIQQGHYPFPKWAIRQINIPVKEYMNKSNTFKHKTKLINIPTPVEFNGGNYSPLPIDPYILGLWLGDGSSAGLAFSFPDEELINIITTWSSTLGYKIRRDDSKSCPTFHISNNRNNLVWEEMCKLNLKNNKHIPKIYKQSSVRARKELLAGVLDTDGSNTGTGSIDFTVKQRELCEGVMFIARSLGLNVFNIREKKVKLEGWEEARTYYRISISGNGLNSIPFKRIKYSHSAIQNYGNRGFKIEPCGDIQYYGFTLDADNLYLLEDFTIDHNCGKTPIRRALADFAGDTAMLVPTNPLIEQETDEFPDTRSIRATHFYPTAQHLKRAVAAVSERNVPILCVPHMYLARRLMRRTVIFDEGHRLIDFNQELQSEHLWRKDVGFPITINNRADFEAWARGSDDKKVRRILEKLVTNDYLFKRGKEKLRGKWEDQLALIPISPPMYPAIIRGVKKLILLSATLSDVDLEDLGVTGTHRVVKLELPSVIPVDRRPIYKSYVGNLAYASLDRLLPMISSKILAIAARRGGKGIVHVTYDLASRLRRIMPPSERFFWHDRVTAKDQLARWMESEDGIFFASGFEEGLNLKGDEFQWQIIAKIPWLSLSDPAIKKRAEISNKWYIWQTLKKVIQATGRICRGAEDFGSTDILDGTFERLYNEGLAYGLVPQFFKEAVEYGAGNEG